MLSNNYSYLAQEHRDKDVDIASYVLFGLNSKDRNTATGAYSGNVSFSGDAQPWNNFRIQKPAPLLDAYAKRIGVSEVRFPWAIPNITERNNTFVVVELGTPNEYTITITPGFYNGTELASAINTALVAAGITDLSVSFSTTLYQFTFTNTSPATTYFLAPSADPSYVNKWFTSANLLKTMGYSLSQMVVNIVQGSPLIGMPTQLIYTSYVDIVSSKLHYNNKIKDGNSASKLTTDILVRLYISDDQSAINNWTTGEAPFLIHRQFQNPKMLRWNPDSFIDWFDIQVVDEYGDLVALPPISSLQTYPDFQMTILASEC